MSKTSPECSPEPLIELTGRSDLDLWLASHAYTHGKMIPTLGTRLLPPHYYSKFLVPHEEELVFGFRDPG